jgi:hypothetical protein
VRWVACRGSNGGIEREGVMVQSVVRKQPLANALFVGSPGLFLLGVLLVGGR